MDTINIIYRGKQEEGEELARNHQDEAWLWRMGGLRCDGTAEPVSRDQILGRRRRQGKNISPVQSTTSKIGNDTWLMSDLLFHVMTNNTSKGTFSNSREKSGKFYGNLIGS